MTRPTNAQWRIISGCLLVGLGVGAFIAYGAMRHWSADQWGPVASWVSGALTLAAVVVALRQASIARSESKDLQFARLVDHEVSRRRECIDAVSNLWTALVGMTIEFRSFVDYLDNLPQSFDGNSPRADALSGERLNEPFVYEIGRRFQEFFDRWVSEIQPPLFVALAVLHGTNMYSAVVQINDGIARMVRPDTPGGLPNMRETMLPDSVLPWVRCQRPDTQPLNDMWHNVLGRRDEHLRLVQQHFSLTRADVVKAVRG